MMSHGARGMIIAASSTIMLLETDITSIIRTRNDVRTLKKNDETDSTNQMYNNNPDNIKTRVRTPTGFLSPSTVGFVWLLLRVDRAFVPSCTLFAPSTIIPRSSEVASPRGLLFPEPTFSWIEFVFGGLGSDIKGGSGEKEFPWES